MKRLLISACLLGFECKYCGGSNALPAEDIKLLRQRYSLVPVCPETAGGLPTPRAPSERRGGRVVSSGGTDVTAQFESGADTAELLARRFGCQLALMKEQSPSCGNGRIYDGSFTSKVIPGDGVAVERLKICGVLVHGESELATLL